MRLVYLLPYSPDFNPIEEGFSAMKSWIQANRDYIFGEVTSRDAFNPHHIIWNAVFATMTTENITGWYCDSGYIA
ncbi:hypothetical protein BC835DRAFT_1278886 [Cytidiella melzeri]|nr:hypothetical protein BC835DRAFT_1278886 [Cytidiella melzeri]